MTRTRWNLTEKRRLDISSQAVSMWWVDTAHQMQQRAGWRHSDPLAPPPLFKAETLDRFLNKAIGKVVQGFDAQWEENGAHFSDDAFDELRLTARNKARRYCERMMKSDCKTGKTMRQFFALHGWTR